MYAVLLLCLTVTTSVVSISAGCPVKRCEWFPWETWSDCSSTCGGGTRWRYRLICCKAELSDDIRACISNCNYDMSYYRNNRDEYGPCNQVCFNGGTFTQQAGNCACHDFYDGDCCEKCTYVFVKDIFLK